MSDPWQFCKLVEEDPATGQLVLLKDNVVKLRKYLASSVDSTVPISFLSILGGPSSGKSLYTNLIAEFLNKNGMGWTTSIKENGLQGFAFGSAPTTNGKLVPDEEKSGIYFWPKIFYRDPGNGAKLLWIMHVHHKKSDDESLEQGSLNLLLATASSAVVDIVWKEQKTCMAALTENLSQPLKNQLCLHVVNLIRKQPNEPSPDPSTFPDPEKVFPINHTEAMSGESDKIKLGMQLSQQLSKLFKKVTDETELLPRKLEDKFVTMANFEDFLASCIKVVNSNAPSIHRRPPICSKTEHNSNSLKQPITTSAPQSLEEKIPEEQLKSESESRISKTAPVAEDEVPPPLPKSVPPPSPVEKPPNRKKEDNISLFKKQKNEVKAEITLKETNGPVKETQHPTETTLNWPILERTLHRRLCAWIETNLKRENVGEIKKSSEVILQGIIKDQIKKFKLPEKVSEELFKKIAGGNERFSKFQQVFTLVEQAISNFCSRIDDLFRIISLLTPQRLRKNMQTILSDILEGVERPNVRELVEKGCNKMFPYYEAANERKIQAEKNISQECIHQIRNFYKEEMVLDGEKYYHPMVLKSIHNALVSKLEEVYEDSLGSSGGEVSEERAKLKRSLDNDFDEISRKNMMEIEKCHKSVKDLVAKLKSEYEVKMQTFLEEHPEGVQLERFNQENDQLQMAQVAEFRKKIVELVKEGEKVEQHVNTLTLYMDKSRGYFEEENQDNLKETEKKKAPKGKKDDAMSVSETHQNPFSTRSKPKSNLKELPPLLFHLALNKIGFGMLGNDTTIQNLTYTVAEVAVTNGNEWIYGDEVRDKLVMGDGPHKKVWNLGQCFAQQSDNGASNYTWEDDFNHNGQLYTIKTEFLLGMLLATIKREIENENDGNIGTIVVSVPFWFPSYQRQQVCDATRIAGFSDVLLLNENSATAYFMYDSGSHEENYDTVVVSENSHRVDISLYSYDSKKKKLTMLGHSGNYESADDGKGSWLRYIPGYGIYSWLVGVIGTKDEEDKAIKHLAGLWESAVEKAEKLHYCSMKGKWKVVVSCESHSCVDICTKVVRKVSNQKVDISIDHQAAIHGMASVYARLQSHFQIKYLIQDGMPYFLNIYPPAGGERQVALKKDDTCSSLKQVPNKCKFRACLGTLFICQENSSGKLPIGYLTVKRMALGFTGFEVTLSRAPNGIISLVDLQWTTKSFSNIVIRQRFVDEEFVWEPFNLKEMFVQRYIDLCQEIQVSLGPSGRIASAKEEVKDKANLIVNAINGGKGTFKNGIVKSLILKQANDTLINVDKSDELTENDLKEKIELLENIISNYYL